MPVMTGSEIKQFVVERLAQAGLLDYLDEAWTDVYLSPEGPVVKILLKDASVLERAEEVIDYAERELKRKGICIRPVVRARWKVKSVEQVKLVQPPDMPEGFGIMLRAVLKCGCRTQEVWVSVTFRAWLLLAFSMLDKGEALRNNVSEFLTEELAISGRGFWNPIHNPQIEMSGEQALYQCRRKRETDDCPSTTS